MPARHRPTARRSPHACGYSTPGSASAALVAAPATQLTAKMRLAPKRSARPVAAKASVPAMNPSWVAAINQPKAALSIARRAIRPSAAPLGLNQSDVPSHCDNTTSATAVRRRRADAVTSVAGVKRLRQVVDQVVGVLEADRDAQEALRRPALRPFDRGAVLDQAFDAAEAGRAREELDPRRDRHPRLLAAARLERQHAAEIAHLPLRERVEGVAGQPG